MSQRLRTGCIAASLFIVNLWVVKTLLFSEFINQMYSIEGTHIALGRFILKHWGDLHWFPLWYNGVPFQNTYPPAHPFLVAAVAGLCDIAPPLAYHALTAIFYALGPVTLFLLAFKLSGSRWYSCVAALVYSFSSSSTLLIPVVWHDVGGFWHARRLQVLVRYGEGPHIASMTLFPLTLLFLILAFEKRKPWWWAMAGVGLAATALTNWLGAFSLALAVLAWLLVAANSAGLWRWLTAIGLGLWAYAIACPWLLPSTILTTFEGETLATGSAEALGRPMAILVGVLLFFALYKLLRLSRAPSVLAFSTLFLFATAYLTLAAEWRGIAILHQATRLHLEMEMGIALAVSFGAKWILDLTSRRTRVVAACAILAISAYGAVRYGANARSMFHAIDVHRTIEYREAQWISENLKGQRVLVPGSVGFFLNVFSDTPQMNGGYYQGIVNPFLNHALYQILSGDSAGADEGAIAVTLLKAFGVDAVGVSGPNSEEAYKPFSNPKKFEGILPELWRDGDDVIYRIPRRSQSLAHVVRLADLPARVPSSTLDMEPILPYLRALDDPSLPTATMTWLNQHSAAISASLQRDQILSVQISYHRAWTATVNGRPCRILRDNLGQFAVLPDCVGPCEVKIEYYGGTEMLVASAVCWSALLGGLAWIVIGAAALNRRAEARS